MLASCVDLYSLEAEVSSSIIAWGLPSVWRDGIVLSIGPLGRVGIPCELGLSFGMNQLKELSLDAQWQLRPFLCYLHP